MPTDPMEGIDVRVKAGTARTADLITLSQEYLRKRVVELAPDGDISPSAGFLLPNEFAVLPIPAQMFNSGLWKEVLAQKIAMTVRTEKARAVCMISKVFGVAKMLSKAEFDQMIKTPIRQIRNEVKDNPDRKEAFMLMIYDRNGEQMWITLITRHKNRHPTLGEWEHFDGCKSRFSETIMPAFAENN